MEHIWYGLLVNDTDDGRLWGAFYIILIFINKIRLFKKRRITPAYISHKNAERLKDMDIGVTSFVLSAIQTVAIIISAFLFLYQLKQFNHNLYQDAYTKLADYSMQINEFLLHNKSLSNQFYQKNIDYRDLDDGQKDLYNYLALMLGLYEHLYILLQAKRIDQKIWAAWERWLVQVIFSLDVFPYVWRNERTMYHEDFYKYVDAKLREHKILVAPVRPEDPVS